MNILSGFVSDFWVADAQYPWLVASYFGLLGAVLASFGGVLIDRLPHQLEWLEEPDETLSIWGPRSHCNSCQKKLSAVDLVPVLGWLVRWGKCGSCGAPIPKLYPISEFLLAAAFASAYLLAPGLHEAAVLMLFIWCGFVITMLDLRHHWIPAVITTPMLWLGLLCSPLEPDVMQRVIGAAAAGMIIWGAVAIVSVMSRKSMLEMWSGGDVAFLMMAGAWMGPENVIQLIFMAAVIFVVHERAVFYRTGERWVPFGPALSAGLLLQTAAIISGVQIGLF